MINNVTLVGRLTKDPELKYTQSGTAVCNFTIAVNSTKGQDADFINCVTFNKTAESLANYQKKGNLIGLTGIIKTRNYENNQGQRRYITEVWANNIQFLEPRPKVEQTTKALENAGRSIDIKDSDLPF